MSKTRSPVRPSTAVARLALLACAATALAACGRSPVDDTGPVAGWDHWGNDPGGQRHSPLTQITPQNVDELKVAWTYRIGAVSDQAESPTPQGAARRMLAEGMAPEGLKLPALEATPILAEGRLYVCSSRNKVVALDPESGREIWVHDPQIDMRGLSLMNCRGVTYFEDEQAAPGAVCRGRIVAGTLDGRLIQLDAATGARCAGFGSNGEIDLRAGLGRNQPGDYAITSPPVVVGDKLIVGGKVEDTYRTDMPAGVVRAFDVRTGALAWAWNPLPPGRSDAEVAGTGEPYVRATPNAWGVFSTDPARGLVFLPTGNVQLDLYGGDRGGLTDGTDHYSSSVVALEAATGRVVWSFQTVHHDIWDYDVASQPVLFDWPTAAGPVPALVQPTKQGHLYVLNRETGEPLLPVDERPVPQGGAVPGEYVAPTQPFPANAAFDLSRGALTEDDMWGFTPWDRGKCREAFRRARYEGPYTPPSLQGTLTYPNNLGIMNWGSVSIDPVRKLLIANTSHVATVTTLVPREEATRRIEAGEWLLPQIGTPYAASWQPFLSPWGAPCNRPPWGALVAIDLERRERAWEVPLGTTRDLAPFPLWLELGTPNVGGALTTATGLTFIGAATDNYLRAFETTSGELLWKGRLPAGPQATPMTYRLRTDGRQFVVVAAGGHRYLGTTLGDYLVAFSL
jgi:quinoprotein glucose dehydrogenase